MGHRRRRPADVSGNAISVGRWRAEACGWRKDYQHWSGDCSGWQTSVAAFNVMIARAVEDLRALYISNDGGGSSPRESRGILPPSGVTHHHVVEALSLNPRSPSTPCDTLLARAHARSRYGGTAGQDHARVAPGRDGANRRDPARSLLRHDRRHAALARALHETWRWTGDDELVRELLPYADRALEWIDRYGDLDGDGFVEYMGTRQGPVEPGLEGFWRRSSISRWPLPGPPIALVEVQGYVTMQTSAWPTLPSFWPTRPRGPVARPGPDSEGTIIRHFWIEELGMFALPWTGKARSPRLLPMQVTSCGAGCRSRGRRSAWSSRLMSADMFSGWGIRTLSAAHKVYNPMSYHNGSVWPHDNAIVAMGFGVSGWRAEAGAVLDGLYEACAQMESNRLPELFCGMQRTLGDAAGALPVSC